MGCLWLCLVQWFDTQLPTIGSASRQAMSCAMKDFETLLVQKIATEKKNKENNER
jgi:hypothetical protein